MPHTIYVSVSASDACSFSDAVEYYWVGEIDFFDANRFREDRDGFRLGAGSVDVWRLDTSAAADVQNGGRIAAALFQLTAFGDQKEFIFR